MKLIICSLNIIIIIIFLINCLVFKMCDGIINTKTPINMKFNCYMKLKKKAANLLKSEFFVDDWLVAALNE